MQSFVALRIQKAVGILRELITTTTTTTTTRGTATTTRVASRDAFGSNNRKDDSVETTKGKGKGKDRVFARALLTREVVTGSALSSRKWQLIGMS